MKAYRPVPLPLEAAPSDMVGEHAVCPSCRDGSAGVIGRIGQRLVFRCRRCRVRFHRVESARVGA